MLAIHLETKEKADQFFEITGFGLPTCGCSKTNWDYREETCYDYDKREFGNIRYYQAINNDEPGKYEIISFEEYMEKIGELKTEIYG